MRPHAIEQERRHGGVAEVTEILVVLYYLEKQIHSFAEPGMVARMLLTTVRR